MAKSLISIIKSFFRVTFDFNSKYWITAFKTLRKYFLSVGEVRRIISLNVLILHYNYFDVSFL